MEKNTQSHWLVCGFDAHLKRWLIISNMPPQLSPELFYKKIEPHRGQYRHFGVWVVPFDWSLNCSKAPEREVKSIDEIFKDDSQIKSYSDILEKMVFLEKKKGAQVVVLAQREGYVMLKEGQQKPFLLHWQELLKRYKLDDMILDK